jgi:hypothetical protein
MEPEGSIQNSQELSTCPYTNPIHLRLGLPSALFPSGFPTNNLYVFLFSLIRATCSANLILNFIILTIWQR